MQGYPKRIAGTQDIINLLADERFKEKARADLDRIAAVDDDNAVKVISGSEETGDLVTEQIINPRPLWKRLGFKTKAELTALKISVEKQQGEEMVL